MLTSGSPIPAVVLFGEVKEGAGDSGIVGDEPTIDIGKAEEGLYILDFHRGRPGGDAIEFNRVHGELTGFHDHS